MEVILAPEACGEFKRLRERAPEEVLPTVPAPSQNQTLPIIVNDLKDPSDSQQMQSQADPALKPP